MARHTHQRRNRSRRLKVERLERRHLLAAGMIDTGFGSSGHVTTDFGGNDLISAPAGIAIQADGKIVAAGQGSAGLDFLVARYGADGSLDPSFNGTGTVATNLVGTDRGYAVAIQPDGKILVGGRAGSKPAIVRYNDDGTLDTSFGSGGISVLNAVSSNQGDKFLDLAIQSDGMIVGAVNGDFSNQLTVVRLTSGGGLDPGFSGDGIADIDFQASATEFAHAVKIQADGKIVVVGRVTHSPTDGSPDIALARLTSAGALDTGFGSGGKVQTALGATEGANDVAFQSDGKIVIGSQSLVNDAALLRYTTAGVLDPTFGVSGVATPGFGVNSAIFSIEVTTTDKIVAAMPYLSSDFSVAQFESDGTLDGSFGTSGIGSHDVGSNDFGFSLKLQSDGKIVVGGGSNQNFAVSRFTGDPVAPPANDAPEITSLSLDQAMILENESVTLSVDFSDLDAGDEHTVTIDWGDGSSQTETLTIGNRTFSFSHQYLDDGDSPGNGTSQDDYTISVTVTDNGSTGTPDLLVASFNSNEVLRYDGATGAFVSDFVSSGSGGVAGPVDVEYGPDGNLYVSSSASDEILRYDGSTGAFTDAFITAGSGGLDSPFGFTFGPDGNLYVASRGTSEVLRYDGATGTFIDAFVTAGSGGLEYTNDVTFGPDGNLYVASEAFPSANDAVLRYDGTTGAFIDLFAATVNSGAQDIVFGPDGNLYLITPHDFRILRSSGTTAGSMTEFSSGGSTPVSMNFGNDGHLYVSNGAQNTVIRRDVVSGTIIDTFVSAGSGGLSQALEIDFMSTAKSDTASGVLTVKNVDPVAADQLYTMDEDGVLNLNVLAGSDDTGPFTVDDQGSLDAIAAVAGTYPTAEGGSVTIAADGQATYTPAVDFAGTDSFEYTVEDDDTGSDTGLVTIFLDPVNDEPGFTMLGNQTVAEDSGTHVVPGFATAVPGGGADEADQSFTYNVGNDNGSLFAAAPAIDASGQLTYELAPNASGIATITVSVTDDGGTSNGGDDTSAAQTFQITVASTAQQFDAIQDSLQQLVDDGKLPAQQARIMNRTLVRAERFNDLGRIRPTYAMLRRVKVRVNVLVRRGILSETDGDLLNDSLDAAINSVLQN